MPSRISRRAEADVTVAAAAYLASAGWLAALASPAVPAGMLAVAAGAAVLARIAGIVLLREPRVCTPADRVTLIRAVLVACCAAQAVLDVAGGHAPGWLLVVLGACAFALDAVDGPVARRTRTASPAGARLDTETDAALTLVLSCAAAAVLGGWALVTGLLYYGFTAAGAVRPGLRGVLPVSPLRKVIGGLQPLTLLLALTPGVPPGPGTSALLVALGLLLFSFGRDAAALERMHRARPVPGRPVSARGGRR